MMSELGAEISRAAGRGAISQFSNSYGHCVGSFITNSLESRIRKQPRQRH